MPSTSKLVCALVSCVAAFCAVLARAQSQISPLTQINWAQITGNGAPSSSTGYCPNNTATANTVAGSPTLALSSITGVLVNQAVTGTGIPSGTTIIAVNGAALTATMSANATATNIGITPSFYSLGRRYVDKTNNASYTCGSAGWFGPTGSGTVSGQASGVIPMATGATMIGTQSHINENTPGFDTFTQTISGTGIVLSGAVAATGTVSGSNLTSGGHASADLPISGGTMTGVLNLSGDTPTGHQAASSNASVVTFSVLAYGAKGDMLPVGHNVFVQATFTSGSNVVYVPGASFTSADVGKYIGPAGFGMPELGYQPAIAQIIGVNDSTHIVISVNATVSGNSYIVWGTDNTPAFEACQEAAYASVAANTAATCFVPSGTYMFATSPYYVLTGAQDDGGYSQPGGGSGAAFTCTPSSGLLNSCTVTAGGSGYTPNAVLQTTLSGGCPTSGYAPCQGAFVTAATNASGVVVSATPVYGGFGYTSTVSGTVNILGGDGAAATATLTGTTMNVPALTAGGAGYPTSSYLTWYAIGGGCTSGYTQGGVKVSGYGTVPTNSSGVASGTMTVTSNATGCSSAPVIVFTNFGACNTGTLASPSYTQCTNLAPLAPLKLPVNILIRGGVAFSSNGALLYSPWDGSNTLNQPVLFGGSFKVGSDVTGPITLYGFFDVAAVNNINYSKLSNITFDGGIGLWTGATDIGSYFDRLSFNTGASWSNGGAWTHRSDLSAGTSFWNESGVTNMVVRSYYNSTLDDWFNNNFWHAEFSGASTDMPETCAFPETLNQRQTSEDLSRGLHTGNTMCYRGITSLGLAVLMRDNGNSLGGDVNGLVTKNISRYIFDGPLSFTLINAGAEASTPLASDPYRAAATQEGALILTTGGVGGILRNINPYYSANSIQYYLWSTAMQGTPYAGAYSWTNLYGSGAQNYEPISQLPTPGKAIFGGGVSSGPHTPSITDIDFYGTTSNGSYSGTGYYMGGWKTLYYPTFGIEYRAADGVTDLLDIQSLYLSGYTYAHGLFQSNAIGLIALSNPSAPSGTPSTSTGSIAAGTYYAKVAAVDGNGFTTASSAESAPVTLTSTGQITFSWSSVAGAKFYNLYIGTSSGGENLCTNVGTGSSFIYSSPIGNTCTPSAPPTVNTTGSLMANTVQIASGTLMTGSAGNGGYAQETTSASKTSGDMASYDANSNVVDSGIVAANVMRNCGTVTFTSSTSSAALSCAWVTASSHCQATWIGSILTGGTLGYTAGTGTLTLTAATSNSGTASVACSVN